METTTQQTKCYCSDLQGVLCGVCRRANTDVWHDSKSGKASIRMWWHPSGRYQVYALNRQAVGDSDGKKALITSEFFDTKIEAQSCANYLWGTL